MKTTEELRKELNRLYCAAANQKHIASWTDFAKLVGVPYPTIYRIVNDKTPLSEKMYKRIVYELGLAGVIIEGGATVQGSGTAQNISAPLTNSPITNNNTTTDERWFALVAEKDAQINRLLGIIEKMQQ